MNFSLPGFQLSDIDLETAKQYLRVDDDYDDMLIAMCITSAIDYIRNYTNLSLEELDEFDSLTMAALILISDFYDNRSAQVESNTKINNILSSILSMNRDLG